MTSLYVVSRDTKWTEYARLALEPIEIHAFETAEQALVAFRENHPSDLAGVVIRALGLAGASRIEAVLEATDFLTALRMQELSKIPVLVWSPVPSERLSHILPRFKPAALLSDNPLKR